MFGHAYFGAAYFGPRYFGSGASVVRAPYFGHAYFGRTFWGDRYFPGNALVIVTPPSQPTVTGGGARAHRPRLAPEIIAVLHALELPPLQFNARVSVLPAEIQVQLRAELPRLTLEGLVGDVTPADMEALRVAISLSPQQFSTAVELSTPRKRWNRRQDEDELEAHYLACLALMGKVDA